MGPWATLPHTAPPPGAAAANRSIWGTRDGHPSLPPPHRPRPVPRPRDRQATATPEAGGGGRVGLAGGVRRRLRRDGVAARLAQPRDDGADGRPGGPGPHRRRRLHRLLLRRRRPLALRPPG